jgi:hypothetical protein
MTCILAIFTIGGSVIVFVMAMILHLEWQGKVRNQIDEVVDEDDMVDRGIVPSYLSSVRRFWSV